MLYRGLGSHLISIDTTMANLQAKIMMNQAAVPLRRGQLARAYQSLFCSSRSTLRDEFSCTH